MISKVLVGQLTIVHVHLILIWDTLLQYVQCTYISSRVALQVTLQIASTYVYVELRFCIISCSWIFHQGHDVFCTSILLDTFIQFDACMFCTLLVNVTYGEWIVTAINAYALIAVTIHMLYFKLYSSYRSQISMCTFNLQLRSRN